MNAYGPDIQPIIMLLVAIAGLIPLMLGAVWVASFLPSHGSATGGDRKKDAWSLVPRHS